MENLFNWYSLALTLSSQKRVLKRELEQASDLLKEIENSLTISQQRLISLLSQDHVTLEDIQQQERHMLLLGKLLLRKRAALMLTAGEYCLKYIKFIRNRMFEKGNFVSPEELRRLKEGLGKGLEYLIEEQPLQKSQKKEKLNSEMMRMITEIFVMIQDNEVGGTGGSSLHEQERVY